MIVFAIKSRHHFSSLSLLTAIILALATILLAGAFSLKPANVLTSSPISEYNSGVNAPTTPYVKGVSSSASSLGQAWPVVSIHQPFGDVARVCRMLVALRCCFSSLMQRSLPQNL